MAHAEIWFPHDQFSVKWATISPWVMWKSDFHMGHVEIWFLVISAIGDFTNFLKMYGNLSMAIAYTNSYRNKHFFTELCHLQTYQNYEQPTHWGVLKHLKIPTFKVIFVACRCGATQPITNKTKKPIKSVRSCKFCSLRYQFTSKLMVGISLKILRITIREMISNCLTTQEVNDLGR
mgnify:CR=1 FL=1